MKGYVAECDKVNNNNKPESASESRKLPDYVCVNLYMSSSKLTPPVGLTNRNAISRTVLTVAVISCAARQPYITPCRASRHEKPK